MDDEKKKARLEHLRKLYKVVQEHGGEPPFKIMELKGTSDVALVADEATVLELILAAFAFGVNSQTEKAKKEKHEATKPA